LATKGHGLEQMRIQAEERKKLMMLDDPPSSEPLSVLIRVESLKSFLCVSVVNGFLRYNRIL
jgi:hypothetical protein